jgi:hypothetical protein
MSPGQLAALLPAAACTVFLTTACANEPTGPSAVPLPSPAAVPRGLNALSSLGAVPINWTWLGAGPPGNCMADRLNQEMSREKRWPQFGIRVARPDDSSIRVEFNPHLEDDVGWLPAAYAGRVVAGRMIEATFAPHGSEPFFDPYASLMGSPRCYDHWLWIDGQLTGTIDAAGMIEGTVLDTFRHPPSGGVFTVKTSFQTVP